VNILFVCSRNKWRSATAESIYKNNQEHIVRSGGTSPSAVVRVSAKNIFWADLIFVMEKKHKQILIRKFPDEAGQKKIVVLGIEDKYEYMDTELIEIIKRSVEPYLPDLNG
jgi:protein-tyrosine phosphatase